MQITNIAGFHTVTPLTMENSDYRIAQHTGKNQLSTVQSILIKAPETSETSVVIESQKLNGVRQGIMRISVGRDSTKVIGVKLQLPTDVGLYANASAAGTVITVNGVVAELG
jgi:hypothetical protein